MVFEIYFIFDEGAEPNHESCCEEETKSSCSKKCEPSCPKKCKPRCPDRDEVCNGVLFTNPYCCSTGITLFKLVFVICFKAQLT